MRATVFHETGFKGSEIHPAAEPESPPANYLQELFSGVLPMRGERSMADILAERLAEADPDSPCPVFVP